MNITEAQIERARIRAIERSPFFDRNVSQTKLSEKGSEIAEFIDEKMDEICSDARNQIKGLVSLIIGESLPCDVENEKLSERLQHGQVLVNADGDRFGLVSKDTDGDYRSFISFGSNDYGQVCTNEYARAATEEEINNYFEALTAVAKLSQEMFDSDFEDFFRNRKP